MGETTVELQQGKLTGVAFPGHLVYRGVPFAAAPVGPLRWKRPQPHPGWEGVLRAEQFAAPCLQPGNLPDTFYGKEFYQDTSWQQAMREDCLYLNIWTPTDPPPAGGYPVACWIHGGAFNNGFGHETTFDGAGFCRRGVILVTIQYRLNVFGFFDHPWLVEEDPQGLSGNYGLYDQMAALTWIRDNIGAFGGNPARVTIFGQSAGARSVQLLTESPLTEELFSQAILQSGAGLNRSRRSMRASHSLRNGQAFAQTLGVTSLSALRALPGERLMKAYLDHMGANPEAGCGIHWDGHLIGTGIPETEHEQGTVHIHPGAILVGAMADEFTNISRGASVLPRMWPDTLGWVADACVARGIPAYVYHFERKLPGDDAGAFHSGDLWYVFETLARSWRPFEPVDYRISGQVAAYWTNFIRTGDPNGGELPVWEACKTNTDRVLRINDSIGMGRVPD